MPDGQVVFEITGDNRSIENTLRDTTRSIQRESRNWDNAVEGSSDNMRQSMSRAFDLERLKNWGIAAAKAIGNFIGSAIEAASELEEVQNVVEVTFGSSTSAIDTWAQNAIKQFGMSETMAKRFASTMGAMMKSAGMAGPEIVEMSETLSGLAADMASFYNLDYETAFAKIRSGISGETEPLKQLGINMSVANLEAYALTQGITKAFDKMSQSEQIQLRYQYLMQATADAQGDFARTSDGYANSVRSLDEQVTNLKANLGGVFESVALEAVGALNGLLGLFQGTSKQRTVLDEFNEIETQAITKMVSIKSTAELAQQYVETLDSLASTEIKEKGLTTFIDTLSGDINGLGVALALAKIGDYDGTLDSLAEALSKDLGGSPDEWKKLLTAVSGNLPGAANAASTDDGKTAAFLEAAAAAADDLGGDYSTLWGKLLGVLGDKAGGAVTALAQAVDPGSVLAGIAKGANSLDSGSGANWTTFLGAVSSTTGIDGLDKLANALVGTDEKISKVSAWQTLLETFKNNADALTSLTGQDAEGTKAWLDTIAASVNSIDADDAAAWDSLFAQLAAGLPGLADTEEGQNFYTQVLSEMLALGTRSAEAQAAMAALGLESDDVASLQGRWLEMCRQLVKTIPGLSDIIDTETGAIQGGTKAVEDYIEAWSGQEILNAQLEMIKAQREALERQAKVSYPVQIMQARADAMADLIVKMGMTRDEAAAVADAVAGYVDNMQLTDEELANLLGDWEKSGGSVQTLARMLAFDLPGETKEKWGNSAAITEYARIMLEAGLQTRAAAEAAKILEEEEQHLSEETGKSTEELRGMEAQLNDTGSAAQEWSDDVKASASEAYDALVDASEALADYYKSAWDDTRRGVDQTVKGLESIVSPAKAARQEMEKLDLAGKKFAEDGSFSSEYTKAQENLPTYSKIANALQSQLDFMDEYKQAIATAQEMGMDEGLLAMLSDGSEESLDYLNAIIAGVTQEGRSIDQINALYKDVQDQKDGFTDALTEARLKVDDEFTELQKKLEQTIADLNQYDVAKENAATTVQGIADGIAEKISPVEEQVNRLNAALSTLQGIRGMGYFGGAVSYFGGMIGGFLNGSHASGLDYVPFDNYLAQLHEGESILTAEEAKVWRQFRYGQNTAANSIDYGTLGASIWDNAPSLGGNVYLDGQTVGRVISAQQANSYRALQRSGWQQ